MKTVFLICLLILISFSFSYTQNMGVKLASGALPNTTLDVNGAASFREGAALVLANGVNNDVTLTDYSFFRLTGATAGFSITGFSGGQDGRILTIVNATTQILSLSHQITSVAANQINTGGSTISLAANGVATLVYNATLAKWVITGVNGAVSTPLTDIVDLKGTSSITAGTISATGTAGALGVTTATIYTITFTLTNAALVLIDAIVTGDNFRTTSNAVITDSSPRMFKSWWEVSGSTNKYGATTTPYTNTPLDTWTLNGTWCNNSNCHIMLSAGTHTLNLYALVACSSNRTVRVNYGGNSNERISIKALKL